MSSITQTTAGYIINDDIGIRKELTVQADAQNDYGPPPKPFEVFKKLKSKLLVPRFYLKEMRPDLEKLNPLKMMCKGEDISIEFKGALREEQKPIIDAMMVGLKEDGGGIINAACGTGKTAMANYLICELGKKALIIVHNEYLLQQHLERLRQFTTAKVGFIQGKKIEVEGCDVVIGMLQSISMKTFDPGFFDCFGTVVVDECHHIAARVFSRALFRISTQYMVGLSATPVRQDGLSKVFHWFLGPIRYSKQVEREQLIKVNIVRCSGIPPWYKMEYNYRKKANVPVMITNLTRYPNRTQWIVAQAIKLLVDGRQILLLTDRRDHVIEFEGLFKEQGIEAGVMMGTQRKSEKEKRKGALECQIIVGTYKMVSEGFDCDKLDTLIMATPIKDITQSIGRILRKKHYSLMPLIIDVVDKIDTFVNQGYCRKRQYRKCKKPDCEIELFDKDLEDNDEDFFGESKGIDCRKVEKRVNKKETDIYDKIGDVCLL